MSRNNARGQNNSADSSVKRFVTKLLFVDKVQNKWAKSMIGAISTTVILSLLGLAVTTLYQEFRQLVSESRNISEEEALATARQNIGVDTVEAIPFRNKDSDLQYIAVGVRTLNNKLQLETGTVLGRDVWTIHLLEGARGVYREPEQTNMQAYDLYHLYNDNGDKQTASEKYRKAVFGVVDVDDDGNKEIFSVARSANSGSYSFKVYVYDSLTKELYWLQAGGEHASPMLNYQYSPNAPQNGQVYAWMNQKAEELTLVVVCDYPVPPAG